MTMLVVPLPFGKGGITKAILDSKIQGVMHPDRLKNETIRSAYWPVYVHCYNKDALKLTDAVYEFSNGAELQPKLRKSLLNMLELVMKKHFKVLVDESKEDISHVQTLMYAFMVLQEGPEFNGTALRILQRSVNNKDDHLLFLLDDFLARKPQLNSHDKAHIASFFEAAGKWFLSDKKIKDPLEQVIVIANAFYYEIYDERISNIIFRAVRQLSESGDRPLAVEHCFTVWRNVNRKNDPVAKRIASKAEDVLRKLFSDGKELRESLGDPVSAEQFGIPEENAEDVSNMVVRMLNGAEVDEPAPSYSGFIGGPPKATIGKLLSSAVKAEGKARDGALAAVGKIITTQMNNKASSKWILRRVEVLREHTQLFWGESYGAIREQLEHLELFLLGEFVHGIMKTKIDNPELKKLDELVQDLLGMYYYPHGPNAGVGSVRKPQRSVELLSIFFRWVANEAYNGDPYLAERIFSIPQFGLREFEGDLGRLPKPEMKRFMKEIFGATAHTMYDYLDLFHLRKDRAGVRVVKSFLKAIRERFVFMNVTNIINLYSEKLCKDWKKPELALEMYRVLGEGEPVDSLLYHEYLLMSGIINKDFMSNPFAALLAFKRIIDTAGSVEDKESSGIFLGRAQFYLGTAYMEYDVNEDEKAVEHLEKAAELMPSSEEHWSNLALAYENLGFRKQAKGAMVKAVENSGDNFFFRQNAAYFFINIKEYETALEIVKAFIKKHRNADDLMRDIDIYTLLIELYTEFGGIKNGHKFREQIVRILKGLKKQYQELIVQAIDEVEKQEEVKVPNKLLKELRFFS
jgi:tetratricopeptide (TPR) repeat protein